MPAAVIDSKALRKAVAAAIKAMEPGRPGPRAPRGVTPAHVAQVSALIDAAFQREYTAHELRTVARRFDERRTTPEGGCLSASDGPFTRLPGADGGANGTVWLTHDRSRVFKLAKVHLVDEPGHPVTELFDMARREFAVGKEAARLGVGPHVHDAWFCCSTQDACYYVIVMDAVPGVTLRKWLRTATESARARMRARLLEAVAKLHDAGVEHTDLHSGNVVVTPEEVPVLIDFGWATWTRDRRRDLDMVDRTFSGTVSLDDVRAAVATALIASGAVRVT